MVDEPVAGCAGMDNQGRQTMSLIHQSVSRVMKRSVLLIAAGVALFTTSAFAEEKVYR
ncbi:ABC transporter substrate-binding protein, partial [Vibrio parahaemolyticus]|nr:ABC transporter substrate-binding protein [Vibrio parahaemolyticus]